jgi:hypothetical protein
MKKHVSGPTFWSAKTPFKLLDFLLVVANEPASDWRRGRAGPGPKPAWLSIKARRGPADGQTSHSLNQSQVSPARFSFSRF